jgi:O-antigen/teichoic acid export membrane protein
MVSNDFVRRLGWSFLHQGVGRGAVFVFFAVLPTWVSLEAAGLFAVAYASMQVVFQPVFDTAVGTLLSRAAAQDDRAAVRQLGYGALVLLSVLLGVGLAAAAAWHLFTPLWMWLAAYFALSLPLNMAFAICRGYGRFDVEGVIGSLQKGALLPLLAVAGGGEHAPAQALALSAAVGWALFAAGVGWPWSGSLKTWMAAPAGPSPAGTPFRDTLYLAALATVALLYLRIDLVLLDIFSGPRDVGIYATASRWMEAAFVLPFGVMLVLFPQLSSRPLDRSSVRQSVRVFAGVGVVTFLASLIAAWWVVPLVYDETLGPVITGLLITLSPTAMAVSVGMLFSQTLVASGRTRLALVAGLVGLATKLVIAFVAIPRLGPDGAAIAAVGTETAVAITAGLLLRRVLRSTHTGAPDPV